ncbi:MAG: hypothetical protein ACRDI2_05140 [Chloroflexota bacterium]
MTADTAETSKTTKSPTPERRRVSRAVRRRPVRDTEAAERAALWADPAFQAALDEGRASFTEDGGISGEDLDERLGVTDEDRDEAAAWLDEYERRLAVERRPRRRDRRG